jgi:hypothetical protein
MFSSDDADVRAYVVATLGWLRYDFGDRAEAKCPRCARSLSGHTLGN